MADDIEDMIAGNRRFRQAVEADSAFFRMMAEGRQSPKMLWIGCADSRVDPGEILGQGLGDLFVIRNIANVVPPANSGDDSVGAAIEYCLRHLGVDDIVVCGHTGCGGIKALGQKIPAEEPHLDRWVDFARSAHRLIGAAQVPENERLAETIKANVLFQQDNLMSYRSVREALEKDALRLHGWVYDMASGELWAYDPGEGDWRTLEEHAARRAVPA